MGIFSLFKDSETLYFPGCNAYYKNKTYAELYKKIFSKLGIDFKTLQKYNCCGLKALEFGYETEARKLARKNFDSFQENNIRKIITSCPGCYKMLLSYKEMLPDWDIEIENTLGLILEKLADNPRLIKRKVEESITYHDSCYLGRHCNIYNEPRQILELLGYKIEEMTESKQNSMCCGGCGGLTITEPDLADKIAKQLLLQAKRLKIKKMVVCSLDNYILLKKNSGEFNIKILEISEVIAKALDIEFDNFEKEDNEEELETIELGKDEESEEEK
ncbi:MAG: (Fe-S)-binding protein [Nanoarchaeota archaeon]